MTQAARDQVISTVFQEIKPYCLQVSKISFAENDAVSSLQLVEALKELDTNVKLQVERFNTTITYELDDGLSSGLPSSLADYIFMPIAQLFKRPSLKDAELEQILSIVNKLISGFWSSNGSLPQALASQLLQLITFLIGRAPNKKKGTDENVSSLKFSEETTFNGIKCLNSLYLALRNQGQSVLQSFLTDTKNLPALGHMVSVLLDISLKLSSNIEAQLLALETLDLLYQGLQDGEVLSFMLPGNVSAMAKLFSNKNGQRVNYNVVAKGLRLLTTLFQYVFDDDGLNVVAKKGYDISEISDLSTLAQKVNDKAHDETKILEDDYDGDIIVEIPIRQQGTERIHRDSSWLKATSYQVKKAFKFLVDVDLTKSKLRNELSEFMKVIIKHNYQTLHLLLPSIIDTYSKIYNIDKLDRISELLTITKHHDDLQVILSSSLNSWIDSIPSTFSVAIPEKVVALLSRITSMLKIVLEFDVESPELIIHNLIKRIHDELVALLQKSNQEKKVVVAASISGESLEKDMLLVSRNYNDSQFVEIENQNDSRLFDRNFDKEVEQSIILLLQELGSTKLASSTLSLILEEESGDNYSNSNVVIDKAVLIWMSSIITKAEHASRLQKTKAIKSDKVSKGDVIDDFLQFSEDDTASENDNETINEAEEELAIELQNNVYTYLNSTSDILTLCLSKPQDSEAIVKSSVIALRSIAYASDVLGMEFKSELIDYIYPVVDSLASTNTLVRTEAQRTMVSLAKNCYNGKVYDLLLDNCDYLVDSLSIRLTGDTITPRTPMVLLVLIQIGGIDILTQLSDIIATLFTLLDLYHNYSAICEGFFAVFNGVVDSVIKEYFTNFDFGKLAIENDDDDQKMYAPWGMTSIEDVIAVVNRDRGARDLELEEDVPEHFGTKDLRKRIKEVVDGDSDDEDDPEVDSDDDDDESDTFSAVPESVISDGIPQGGQVEAKETWQSPISYEMYLMLQKIFTYGDRLSKHNSTRLLLQIQRITSKIIPILATSRKHLLPILASHWPVLSTGLNSDNLLVVMGACDVISQAITYSGSFLCRRYLELWDDVIRPNPKIQKIVTMMSNKDKDSTTSDKKALLNRTSTSNNLELDTFNKVVDLLMVGLKKYGRSIPYSEAIGIIRVCLVKYKDAEEYGYFDDVAWYYVNV